MTRPIKRILAILILIAMTAQVPLVQAEGGLVFEPYWTFTTDSPVTHVKAGDVDGDGIKEIIIVTDKSMVYVLKNDGTLDWQYEKEGEALSLLVDDLDGDITDEIFVGGISRDVLLSNPEIPVTTTRLPGTPMLAAVATDLDRDGQHEILFGSEEGIAYIFSKEKQSYRRGEIALNLPTIDIWAGDADGDGRPEIAPSPTSGRKVYLFEDDGRQAWQQDINGEVGLVQGGDVDGDGQAEIVVLTTAWELFLLDGDGRQIWSAHPIAVGDEPDKPAPGQLMVYDLNGDNRAEIVVVTPAPAATVYVFDGAGRPVWQRSLEYLAPKSRLRIEDVNNDRQAEIAVTTAGQRQVYLLDTAGCCLAVYYTQETSGAFDYADLNNDGWGEIIVGTKTGIQVFGTSDQVGWQEMWHSPRLELVTAPYLTDLDGDGQGELLMGGLNRNKLDSVVYILANDGELLQSIDLKQINIAALSAGDVDGNGQREIAAVGGSRVYLLDGNQSRWSASMAEKSLFTVVVRDVDGDGRAEIIAGGKQDDRGVVALLDGQGAVIWQQEFPAPVTAVDSDGKQILAGTAGGQLYRLRADGSQAGLYDLGAEVADFGTGLVATADGQVYQLDSSKGPTLFRQFETNFKQIQLYEDWTLVRQSRKRIGLMAGDKLVWQKTLAREPLNVAMGDMTGDGVPDVVIATPHTAYIYRNVHGRRPDGPINLGVESNFTLY